MFDKNKFAQIIKNVKEIYNSQEDFSKKSGIGRTYLSQYMNMQLDKPPKPEILEKLANASNGTTTYNELMQVCGYIYITELTPSSYGIDFKYWNLIFGDAKKVTLSQKGSTFFASFLDKMLQEAEKSKNGIFEIEFNTATYIPLTDNIEEFEEYNKIFCFILCSLISNNAINITESEKKQLSKKVHEHLKKISAEVEKQKQDDFLRKIGAIPLSDIQTVPIPILRYC